MFEGCASHRLTESKTNICQGSKKVSSGILEQVDFLAGQVTFKAYLPNRQGSKQVIS